MRYSLRTLLILLAIGPPLVAGALYLWVVLAMHFMWFGDGP